MIAIVGCVIPIAFIMNRPFDLSRHLITRIIPFICAGIHVISERSNDRYYDKIFNSIITFCSKEKMPTVVKDCINNYSLKNILKKRKKLKKKLNFEKIISENINLFNDI